MSYYRSVGQVPSKRHTQVRQADGTLLAEELIGRQGFAGESALLYHRSPPTDLRGIEPIESQPVEFAPNYPLSPYLLPSMSMVSEDGDALWGRRTLLANADVRIGVAPVTKPSELYRNADGDELIFMLRGEAKLETSFGALDVVAGDYVVIPKAIIHRWIPSGSTGSVLLTVESTGQLRPPAHYLTDRGQFLESSPYCERDIHAPTELLAVDQGQVAVVTKQGQRYTRHTLGRHPFDVVGWDGCLYPYKINISDFEPLTGRIHQPPPVHQMFEAPGFVVCSFVPRKVDYHPLAIPAPYDHSNVDTDEVLVYFDGDFLSRKGVNLENGSMTLHPVGITHGPQPGSVEASLGRETTNETAVMIDTFTPLEISTLAREASDPDYPGSWQQPQGDNK